MDVARLLEIDQRRVQQEDQGDGARRARRELARGQRAERGFVILAEAGR